MKKSWFKAQVFAAATIGIVGSVEAAPITYDLTATNFSSAFGSAVPIDSIAGSFTFDSGALTDIDLTIGSHTYTVDEFGSSDTFFHGGTLNTVNAMSGSTDDFMLLGSFDLLFFGFFDYATAETQDFFTSYTGSIVARPAQVSETSSIALLGASFAALLLARRRKI